MFIFRHIVDKPVVISHIQCLIYYLLKRKSCSGSTTTPNLDTATEARKGPIQSKAINLVVYNSHCHYMTQIICMLQVFDRNWGYHTYLYNISTNYSRSRRSAISTNYIRSYWSVRVLVMFIISASRKIVDMPHILWKFVRGNSEVMYYSTCEKNDCHQPSRWN